MALDAIVRVSSAASGTVESRIRDLSENGVFLVSRATRPLGTELTLEIDVRPDMVVRARGIVVHEVKAAEETASRPAGMGIMFLELLSDLEELRAFIASQRPL